MDKRAAFFQNYFNKAQPFTGYIGTGNPSQKERWQATLEQSRLTNHQKQLISKFKRKLNVLCMSGIWCGDCSRQGPLLERIAMDSPNIDLRFIDNQSNPELLEELRIQGGARVPVAVFLSEDFFELCRFGDRTLSAYRRKAERELGVACDAGLGTAPSSELDQELHEWLDIFERCQLILQLSPMLRARYGD